MRETTTAGSFDGLRTGSSTPLRFAQDDNFVGGLASSKDAVRPATRSETMPIALAATLVGMLALIVCFSKGYLLLYGDAVAHLGIARRVLDSKDPGLMQLVGVWLPLPHLLMVPLVKNMGLWQSGLAGAWPSFACYVLGVVGFYRLTRRMVPARWAAAATAFYGLNPNLLYLSTTAMTEPLFLALLVWMTLVTMECVEAIRKSREKGIALKLVTLGCLILAATLTRYDGWVLGAAVWCVVACEYWRARERWRHMAPAFALFTLLAVAGPTLWLGLSQHVFHDPLWFMRGPYSAAAVEKKTSPGPLHYRGWHNPAWALLLYTRTAQVDAAVWETGFVWMAAALSGVWIAGRRGVERAALLLWMPLPFYVYSIAYGSVPIFIPQLWPSTYYNSRYGMELLPALALYGFFAAWRLERWLGDRATVTSSVEDGRARFRKALYPAMLAIALGNALAMGFGVSALQSVARMLKRPYADRIGERFDRPLVLKEALVNASTRIPFERNLALVLQEMPKGAPILMASSDYIGALQDAGIPLKQTVSESDYYGWRDAMADPAANAAFVVAFSGDAVSKAVEAHPDGLQEVTILCTTGQPCARIYRSSRFQPPSR